jgi:hypothetical protein
MDAARALERQGWPAFSDLLEGSAVGAESHHRLLGMPMRFVACLLVFAATPAFAQPASQPSEPAPRHYEFTPEEVNGGRHTPGGAVTHVHRARPMPSLIRVRESFKPELLQSANSL